MTFSGDEFAPPGLPIDEWSFFQRVHPHALLIGCAVPLFPLVLKGAFLDTLYYRLNTLCLLLSDSLNVAAGAERVARRALQPPELLRESS